MSQMNQWLWPVLVSAKGTVRRFRFVADDPAARSDTSARCTSDTSCPLLADRVTTETHAPGSVDVEQLLNLAPPVSAGGWRTSPATMYPSAICGRPMRHGVLHVPATPRHARKSIGSRRLLNDPLWRAGREHVRELCRAAVGLATLRA
jgi:hypothetical protein